MIEEMQKHLGELWASYIEHFEIDLLSQKILLKLKAYEYGECFT
jgi:hypothetical protein